MRNFPLFSLLTLSGMVACCAAGMRKSINITTSVIAVHDVSVIDVENGVAIPRQTVIIVGDRIDSIGAVGSIRIPERAQLIDGRGLFLMPGLVDGHVHYFEAPLFGRLMIANGVLLVRDMGMPNDYILKLRDQLNKGEVLGPEMVAAGVILDGDPPQIPLISIGLKTPEEARNAVRIQAQAGVNMIKAYSTLDQEMFLAITDEAQKFGLKVVGHVPDSIYIEESITAGMQSVEHWFGFEKAIARLLGEQVNLTFNGFGADVDYLRRLDEVDPAALRAFYGRLGASGVTVVPTVIIYKVFPDVDVFECKSIPKCEYISPTIFSIWKSQWAGQTMPDFVWKNWVRMVREMSEAGVPLMVGTDLMVPGIIPGFSVHEEMAIWQEAGIPASVVLRSATIIPAKFVGLGDRLGSVTTGKTASIILVRGNPLDDIRNAQQIEGVFLRGQYIDRPNLDRLLDEAKDLAMPPAN